MAFIRTEEQGQLATTNRSIDEAIATRYFLVFYSVNTPPTAAETATDIPAYSDVLPADETIIDLDTGDPITNPYPRRVKAITVKAWEYQDAVVGTIWQVQVDYSDKPDFQDPLSVPPEITWDFADATQNYFIDNSPTPKPVVNSAGQPFEQLLERETGSVVVVYKRNVASFSPALAIEYCGDGVNGKAVNSDAFTIDGASIAANQAIVSGISCGPTKVSNNISYREESITLKLKPSWDDSLADVGFNELSSGNLIPIYMADSDPTKPNIPTDKPWPLDGTGVGKADSTDTPATLTFKPYQKLPFSVFSFT